MNETLLNLASIFEKHSTLYAVGGSVRNGFLGLNYIDIDITSALLPEKIIELLKDTVFNAVMVNKKLGTVLITCGDVSFEHTTFRRENYAKGGAHTPETTSFISDISIDASRRDFTMNAIYYDILKGYHYDPYKGIKDAKKRILRAISPADKTFTDDGLRIFRMVKFATSLKLRIEKATFISAKKNITNLQQISAERIINEIYLILNGHSHYNIKHNADCGLRGIRLLHTLGAFEQIFPDLKLKSKPKFKLVKHKILLPVTAFYIDLYFNSADMTDSTGKTVFSFMDSTLNKLKYDNKTKSEISRLLNAYNELKQDFSQKNILKYFDLLPELINVTSQYDRFLGKMLSKIQKIKIKQNAPVKLKDLKIDATVLKQTFPDITGAKIGALLNDLLLTSFITPELNTKEQLILLARQKLN